VSRPVRARASGGTSQGGWGEHRRNRLLVRGLTDAGGCLPRCGEQVWVPETSSTSCDQVIFVDQASDASLSCYAVLLKVDWFG
jgi:hypothetical protein